METFSALLAICAGNSPVPGEFPAQRPVTRSFPQSPVNSPHKGQWRGALIFSLICVWINGWVNNREAGDLRRHRAHYDVVVMLTSNRHLGCLCRHFGWRPFVTYISDADYQFSWCFKPCWAICCRRRGQILKKCYNYIRNIVSASFNVKFLYDGVI